MMVMGKEFPSLDAAVEDFRKQELKGNDGNPFRLSEAANLAFLDL